MTQFKDTPYDPFRQAVARMFGFGVSSQNQVLHGDGFYVSFAPNTDVGPETALVKDNGEPKFLNLLGDYREAYAKLVPSGYGACFEFFLAQPEASRSHWSDDPFPASEASLA